MFAPFSTRSPENETTPFRYEVRQQFLVAGRFNSRAYLFPGLRVVRYIK